MTRDELLALIDQAEREAWTELDLSGKGLTELPSEIGRLTSLTELNLRGNQLTELPPEIGRLLNLENLDLSSGWSSETGNQLTRLPPEIGGLTNLTELNLDGNNLMELPFELFGLRKLKVLIIGYFTDDNPLRKLPSEIGHLTSLTNLKLWSSKLTELPPEIGQLTNLTELDLGRNNLTQLPSEICLLSNLATLHLTANNLVSLPKEFFQLTNLDSLALGGNVFQDPIAEFKKICKLPKLKRLWYWGQTGFIVPAEIKQLSKLTYLSFHSNNLTRLPMEIGLLSKLESLDLSFNQLSGLPLEFGQLTSLKEFELISNRYDLYADKAEMPPNNPSFCFPPKEVIALGIPTILKYLHAAAKGSKYVWESKCLLIGEGGVGKTTLFEVLNGRPFNKYEQGTVGIEIGSLDLAHPEKEDVTMHLNCWDFAGQDFNHAMHQFFFSNRALFLLVWNARHGWQQGKLYRWLENIKVRAPQAKVILVATHTDQPHSDYPAAELQSKYPQIVATIEVSSKTGENIPQLRHLIQQQAADLPLMGLRWPQTWLDAANAVRALCQEGHTHASRREVVQAMQAHGLNDEECAILLRWLHELGDILHFEDEPDMRGRVILNPEWLTQHVGIVLRSDEVAAQQGILTRRHLNSLWPDLDDYLQDHFLRLMDKFDLAYLIPDDPQDRSLIVERLPLDPPDYTPQWEEFDAKSQITLRFKLGSMQPGIPTWFIARCHRFTMNTHWLNGVLFKDEEDRHRALVIADEQYNTVQMTVRGPFPQRFMSLLRDGFRDTLKRYKGLEVERWVPCPGFNELEERPCQNEFRLDNLENWLEKKPERIIFTCPECDTQLSRLQLVEGIGAAALTQPLTEQRMAEMLQEVEQELKDHMDFRLEDVIRYQQRNFLWAFRREQERELVTCPNVFTLKTMGKGNLLTAKKLQLQLYCQQPGSWHPVGEPYEFSVKKEWVVKALPYLKTLIKILKVVVPIAGAALDVAGDVSDWAKTQHGIFENEVTLMGNVLTAVGEIPIDIKSVGELGREQKEVTTYRKVEGADLVPIRELMDQLAEMDKAEGRPKWAGLTRRQTPEGDILWLDQEHLQEYLSKRKYVPPPEDSL